MKCLSSTWLRYNIQYFNKYALLLVSGLQEGIQLDLPWQALGDYDGHGISSALGWLAGQTGQIQLAKVKVAETLSEIQNGFVLRKESDKVVSFLRTCSTYYWRQWSGRPLMDFKVDYKLESEYSRTFATLMTASCWPLWRQIYRSW